MKKKNLIILLIIPFIISLLGIITINASFSTFYGDITGIDWKYEEVEAFSTNVEKYKLEATAKNSSNAPLAEGNQLVWRVENKDKGIMDPLAEIIIENNNSYLVPKKDGEVIITCSNLKGNISKRMTGILYSTGAITITAKTLASGANIDDSIYYGEYDLKDQSKQLASFDLKYKCIPEDLKTNLEIEASPNLEVKLQGNEINVKAKTISENSDAFITLKANSIIQTYSFSLVDEGVNCYTYDDLLACSNKSENGEIIVLRKNFESLEAYKGSSENNIALFGNYDFKNKKFAFTDEVYEFKTTYNNEYIKQWNKFVETDSRYKPISDKVKAGLHIQKDIYGNGYTINMHNLTYPSLITEVNKDGNVYEIPTLGPNDLFRGPQKLYTLGDPNSLPLITAYGQDNSGIYLDGDNIIINDLNLKNCDMGASLSFLDTVGSVIDINGDNNIIKNSILSNGKTVLRSFSSMNLLLDNSLLSNSLNFLISTGSNEYVPYDELKEYEFVGNDGKTVKMNLKDYFKKKSLGDALLNDYLMGHYDDTNQMKNALLAMQQALNPEAMVEGNFKGSMVIKDTYFYHSGLAAIAFETLFNGPFLYNKNPSMIEDLFGSFEAGGKPIAPYIPFKVTGLSYPVKVDITGKTKFYDYKNPENMDLNGLIDENISKIASEVAGSDKNITIDEVFPIKNLLIKEAKKENNKALINGNMNIVAAYYGGASNLSELNIVDLEKDFSRVSLEVNFLDEYLKLVSNTDNPMSIIKDIMVKCVTVVTGFRPFEFVSVNSNDYLIGESPNIADLISNAKGE